MNVLLIYNHNNSNIAKVIMIFIRYSELYLSDKANT